MQGGGGGGQREEVSGYTQTNVQANLCLIRGIANCGCGIIEKVYLQYESYILTSYLIALTIGRVWIENLKLNTT